MPARSRSLVGRAPGSPCRRRDSRAHPARRPMAARSSRTASATPATRSPGRSRPPYTPPQPPARGRHPCRALHDVLRSTPPRKSNVDVGESSVDLGAAEHAPVTGPQFCSPHTRVLHYDSARGAVLASADEEPSRTRSTVLLLLIAAACGGTPSTSKIPAATTPAVHHGTHGDHADHAAMPVWQLDELAEGAALIEHLGSLTRKVTTTSPEARRHTARCSIARRVRLARPPGLRAC